MAIGPLQICGWEEALLGLGRPSSRDKGSLREGHWSPSSTWETHLDVRGSQGTQGARLPGQAIAEAGGRSAWTGPVLQPREPTAHTPRFPASSLSTEPVDVCFSGVVRTGRSISGEGPSWGPQDRAERWRGTPAGKLH